MAVEALRDSKKYQLRDSDQDLRGKPLVAENGSRIGEIRDMLADTEAMQVISVTLTDGREIAVRDLEIRDDDVVLHDGHRRTRDSQARQTNRMDADGQEIRIPVIEEELVVGTMPVKRGGVRVHSEIQEKQAEVPVTLTRTDVHVERHPADRPASEEDIAAARNVNAEIVASEEKAIAQKTARVVEEVVIREDTHQREESLRGTVRRAEPRIEEIEEGNKPRK